VREWRPAATGWKASAPMAEPDFERRLERLFSETREMADAEAFTARVERRLDRGWRVRGLLIGTAGLVGGVIGASQLLISNAAGQLRQVSDAAAHLVHDGLGDVTRLDGIVFPSAGSEAAWVAGALAVLALGLVLFRVFEEI
jgi:hypothetical protein